MSNRSSIYILSEDKQHQFFLRGFLKRIGIGPREMIFAPIPNGCGSGKQSVLNQFAEQVQLCRRRNNRASTSLLTVMDADELSVDRCLNALDGKLTAAGQNRIDVRHDRVARLVAKWNIETWILYLSSDERSRDGIDEDTNRKHMMTQDAWDRLVPSALEAFCEWHRSPGDRPIDLLESLARGLDEIPRALPARR